MWHIVGCHCSKVQQAAGHNVQFVCSDMGRLERAVRHVLLEFVVVEYDDDAFRFGSAVVPFQ